jgi:microcystin degradation protein MlrC
VRVAVGGLMHETNTFARGVTTLADFEAYQFAVDDQLFGFRGTKTELGGFLDGCQQLDWEVVPTLYAVALPGGLVDHDVFEALVARMTDALAGKAKPDGALLALHGAMVTTRTSDADGDILTAVATRLGLDVPVVTTLDFHANTTDAMARHVDALIGYDTYPHVDMYQRGREAVTVLADVLRGGARRTVAHRKVGVITPPQAQYSDAEPVRSIIERVHALEATEGLSVTVTPGFPYADIDSLGLSVVASSSDPLCAQQVADIVAADVDARAEEFDYTTFSVADAVDRALRADGPVALVDSADNVGGGSPGDGTAILAEWLARGGTGLIVSLTDEEAVRTCFESGVGSLSPLLVGAKTDDRHGSPVEISGSVRMLADGRYVHRGSYATGIITQMGHTAVVEAFGNTIVLTERRVMPFDAQQWLSLGISPAYCRAFVVKSAIAWRAAYEEYPRQVIDVDAPGICTGNLQRLKLSGEHTSMIRPQLL